MSSKTVENDRSYLPRPFIKWAGGKTQLLPELLKRVPKEFGTYYEPFLGGGALFFALRPRHAILGDSNPELGAAYRGVRDEVDLVIKELEFLFAKHSPETYAKVRARETSKLSISKRAARMIYLNKTCFNGLYRVNQAGRFNVPIGKSAKPPQCDVLNLQACSEALRGHVPGKATICPVTVHLVDFRVVLASAEKGDFAYLDPPYAPTSKTANFTAFTKDSFDQEDQVELADLVVKLKTKGVHVLLSNSDTEETVDLYESRGLRVEHVLGRRSINSSGDKRGKVGEILVS